MATATRVRTTINDEQQPAILDAIAASGVPYSAVVTVEGSNKMLFDRYNQDEIEAKKALPKGHVGKKLTDSEAQVYRHPKSGHIAVPGISFLRATEDAAKFVQPVPGRLERSCKPLVQTLVSLDGNDELVDLGIKTWDEIDTKRITLSRGADSLARPAVLAGWRATFTLHVAVPGVLPPAKLRECVSLAGQIIGIGAYRRVYGRFIVINFDYEI
jgi:hypothetical protein